MFNAIKRIFAWRWSFLTYENHTRAGAAVPRVYKHYRAGWLFSRLFKYRSVELVSTGADGLNLTLSELDQLINNLKGYKPDLLLMSSRSRKKVNTFLKGLHEG